MGYNKLYFELKLPNGSIAQILDVMDYVSNYVFMPIVALGESILIGWIMKPDYIIDEVTGNGVYNFKRRKLYVIMIKYVVPVLLMILLINSFIPR